MSEPYIFFPTIAAGGGHVATARAMAQAVEALYPGAFATHVSDYMLELGRRHPAVRTFDEKHKAFWKVALRYPLLARWGQRVSDLAPGLTYALHKRSFRTLAALIAADIARRKPALIVTNHPFLTVSFTLAQRLGAFPDVPVLHFATEPLDASALWAVPDASRFAVPSAAARRDLLRMGVAADKVDVVGYPVQQPFLYAPSRSRARCVLGLEDTFTCLVWAGSEGVSRHTEGTVKALLGTGLQVVAVAGRNVELKRSLEGLCEEGRPTGERGRGRLVVRGFIEDVAAHLAACNLVIGKAGPASVMEALAVGRPVLATGYAGLNERKLIHFLAAQRVGAYVPTSARLLEEVARYRASPERLCEVAQRCSALELAEMTEQTARYLVRAARRGAAYPFEGFGLGC